MLQGIQGKGYGCCVRRPSMETSEVVMIALLIGVLWIEDILGFSRTVEQKKKEKKDV